MRRRRELEVGGIAKPSDPTNDGELYHWTTTPIEKLKQEGLRPGDGRAKAGASAGGHSRGRVFFSADKTKWRHPGDLLVRVNTSDVTCRYDGGEYVGDQWRRRGLVDCFVEGPVPPSKLMFGRKRRA